MNDTQKNLLYLLSCAVNGITPDNAKIHTMDLEKLYRLAVFHSVGGAVCVALQMAGIEDKRFDVSYMKRSVAFVNKLPLLYPAGIVYRWGRILAIRRSYLKRTVRAVRKYGK